MAGRGNYLRELVESQLKIPTLYRRLLNGDRLLRGEIVLLRAAGYGAEVKRLYTNLDGEIPDVEIRKYPPATSYREYERRREREDDRIAFFQRLGPEDNFFYRALRLARQDNPHILTYRARIALSAKYGIDVDKPEELLFRWARDYFYQLDSVRFFRQFTG